jgi:hypothetical protein
VSSALEEEAMSTREEIARLLNDLPESGGSWDDAVAEIAQNAGLNWSDSNGWVIPGDE